MQVAYFLNGPILNLFVFLLFFFLPYCFILGERVTFYEKCSPDVLPLKSKLSGKFQRFNAINRSIEMLKIVEFSKISIKMKNCKPFCEAIKRATLFSLQILQPPPISPPPDKTLLHFGHKNVLKEIFRLDRHLLSKCF